MSVHPLLTTIDELIGLHKEMLQNSIMKTETLKAGQIEGLQKVLMKEQKLVLFLEKAEQSRLIQTERWFAENHKQTEEKTVTNMLAILEAGPEQEKLAEKIMMLTNEITNLKKQEQLNQSLLQQSLQFIQFSLNMVNPTIENFNYGTNNNTITHKKSIFDSKA